MGVAPGMVYVLVAYDISDDEARNRFARDLQAAGFSRLQRSVYVHKSAYRGLVERVKRLARRRMNMETDSVLILVIPASSYEKAVILGRGSRLEDKDIIL